MAIAKNQALRFGEFYPPSDKNVIYRCYLNNTSGFLRDIIIISAITGFFTFLLLQWLALLVVPISWILIVPFLVPKYYKFIQINKLVITFGTGSILALLNSGMKSIYKMEKKKYTEIYHIQLDRWQKKKFRGGLDSFGRIEIIISGTLPPFQILIETSDLVKLVKILESHHFPFKVQKQKSRGELRIIFPSS